MADDDQRTVDSSSASSAGRMRSSNPASGSCNGRSGDDLMTALLQAGVSSSQHEGSCQAPWIRQKVATAQRLRCEDGGDDPDQATMASTTVREAGH